MDHASRFYSLEGKLLLVVVAAAMNDLPLARADTPASRVLPLSRGKRRAGSPWVGSGIADVGHSTDLSCINNLLQ
jgi:hypothetical protein